jgi:hypothetical protein
MHPFSDFANDKTPPYYARRVGRAPSTSGPSTIFYNAFFDPENGEHGLGIVEEQLEQIASSYVARDRQVTIYFNTIGAPILNQDKLDQLCTTRNVDCKLLNHFQSAYEEVTLQSLYDFCQKQANQSLRVAYVHNKGSLNSHKGGRNDIWRRHLTAAALNEQCWNPPDDACNVCGLQFWPIWSTFFPGNMWTAKCSYITKLLPPTGFQVNMDGLHKKTKELGKKGKIVNGVYPFIPRNGEPYKGRFGMERFALEHWVGSHPDLVPCDVCGDLDANLRDWGEDGGDKRNESDFRWSMAPHHPLTPRPGYWWTLQRSKINKVLPDRNARMREYFLLPGYLHKWIYLYNATPPSSSWVWSWYPDAKEWQQKVKELGTNVIEMS